MNNMKNLLSIVLLIGLLFSVTQAQLPKTGIDYFDQRIAYDKTNYTNSLAETTAWFPVETSRELGVLFQSTDSASVVVWVDARNNAIQQNFVSVIPGAGIQSTSDTLALRDSLSGSANMNTGGVRAVLYKSTTLNRLVFPVNNQIRFRVAYAASLNGTTTGRRFKIWWVKTY